jgi:ParB/RepB/Spo0J family partition protein
LGCRQNVLDTFSSLLEYPMDFDFIPLKKIEPNKRNPRGIDVASQDTKLAYLKNSIAKFGVLVPLVVTPKGDRYVLIDGERRYHAAKATGTVDRVPAFIVRNPAGREFSSKDLLLRMFQIHHLREQWDPTQQCNALEKTYARIMRSHEIASIADVRAQVKAVTETLAKEVGIDERTAFDRVKFLRWPDDVKQPLYVHPDEKCNHYICEIEEKIVIPALANYPEYFDAVEVDDVRRDLFGKLRLSLGRGTDVRLVAPFLRSRMDKAADRTTVKRILEDLHTNREMTYGEAKEEFEREFPDLLKRDPPTPRRLLTLLTSLTLDIEEFDASAIGKAQRRAKAKRKDLLSAAESLREAVQDLIAELERVVR